MSRLTLQTYLGGAWQDACELYFSDPDSGRHGAVTLEYDAGYVARFQGNPAARVSARYPLDFFPHETPHWPAFLLDIVPMGAARRYWGQQLNLPDIEQPKYDFQLLAACTRAPIGNLRIKESVTESSELPMIGFQMSDVLEQATEFLDYARAQGAAVGGATGAGGDAPKYLLTRGADGLCYPDGSLPDSQAEEYFLVKFPRRSSRQGRSLASDSLILETEHAYYKVAQRLGFDTISSTIHIESGQPGREIASLWMPRFDRVTAHGATERLAVESLYSLSGVIVPGATIHHTTYLKALTHLWNEYAQSDDIENMVQEYLRRDLLNVVSGNSDNHGRNTSVMRLNSGICLAPVYDLAPMVLDEAGITRTSRWSNDNEIGGNFRWREICDEAAAATHLDGQRLWSGLRDFALTLFDLPEYASEFGVPEQVMDYELHALNLKRVPDRLKQWGLL